jgi:hypothetical protein
VVAAARVSLCVLSLALAGTAAAGVSPAKLPLLFALQGLKANEQAAFSDCSLAVLNRTKPKIVRQMLRAADDKLAQADRSLRTIRGDRTSLAVRLTGPEAAIERSVRQFEHDLRRGAADRARSDLSALEMLEQSATRQIDVAIAALGQ